MTAPQLPLPVLREEYERSVSRPASLDEARAPLSRLERVWNCTAVRKATILLCMAVFWQLYAARLDNALMLPTFSDTVASLLESLLNGELPRAVVTSLKVLGIAYTLGVLLAGTITTLALTSRLGTDFLETCTGMFTLLPAIALLPLALLWFGLGYPGIIFVIIHSVTWPMTLNIYSGFTGVSKTLRMVGQNYELSGPAFLCKLLIPAALPHILTGLKIGWAFSWRTLIASELVFGVSAGSGGIGWFIYENKNQLDIAKVFAGLIAIILIGVLMENIIFKFIENKTIRRWGMRT